MSSNQTEKNGCNCTIDKTTTKFACLVRKPIQMTTDKVNEFAALQNGEHLNTFGSVVGFNVVLIVTLKVC